MTKAPPFSFSISFLSIIFFISLLFLMPLVLSPVQSAGYDVSVADKDITFNPKAPSSGDTVEINVTVRNVGPTAETVTVAFYHGATMFDYDVKPVVPAVAIAKGYWNTTGLPPGTYKVNVTVSASGDTNNSNNNASISIFLKKMPLPIIVIESLQVYPLIPVDGSSAAINGTVRNDGDANASVEVNFLIDNVSIGKTLLKLDMGNKKNVTFAWDTSSKEGKHEVAITIGTTKKAMPVTVAHKPRAIFEVTKVWISDKRPYTGREVRVYAEVVNIGDDSEDIVVVFKDNTRTYAQSKSKVYAPGENHTVSAAWTAKKGDNVLRVEVQDHPEASNFYTVKPINQGSSACGFSVMAPGMAIIAGCVGVVKLKGPRRQRPAA